MNTAIKVKKLDKEFSVKQNIFGQNKNTKSALKDVSFDINRGEIFGIIGSNGAGKSTLLKIITGIMLPTRGDIGVNGHIESLIELGAAFNSEFTVLDNIKCFLNLKFIRPQIQNKIIEDILEFAELREYTYTPTKFLSSGMYARLAFSTSIFIPFDILIVDEVLSVGDKDFQQKCINFLKSISSQGKTIIFVSHDLHAVKNFCNRVLHIEGGRVIQYGKNVVEIVEKYEKKTYLDTINQNKTHKYSNGEVEIKSSIIKGAKSQSQVIQFGEDIKILAQLEIKKDLEDSYFFGVGFKNSKGEYISGLNTQIDKIKMPSKRGSYNVELIYNQPNLYHDIFTLWLVVYNNTGTVVLSEYITKKAFEVVLDDRLGEGVIIPNHTWKINQI